MSETYLAHSAKNEYPAQSYADHVNGTIEKALHSAKKMAEYCVDVYKRQVLQLQLKVILRFIVGII